MIRSFRYKRFLSLHKDGTRFSHASHQGVSGHGYDDVNGSAQSATNKTGFFTRVVEGAAVLRLPVCRGMYSLTTTVGGT